MGVAEAYQKFRKTRNPDAAEKRISVSSKNDKLKLLLETFIGNGNAYLTQTLKENSPSMQ